jgi:thiamine biosynthesis protein ThiS
MEITVNGERREVPGNATVAGVLEHFGVEAARVVVELNRDIIPREQYDTVPVAAGDVLELVEIVGGG